MEEAGDSSAEDGITMSYDCGWQKRERAMNSLTAVSTGIGKKTRKVIGFAPLSKRCATCATAERLGKVPEPHDCRKNFSKSSKAMEAEAVQVIGEELRSQGENWG